MKVEQFPLLDTRAKIGLDENEMNLMPIFRKLREDLDLGKFVNGTVEFLDAHVTFNPLKPYLIFPEIRSAPKDYIQKELSWYLSQSLSIDGHVDDIAIWKQVATEDPPHGVNSNYGYYVFNEKYGDGTKSQYEFALDQLKSSPAGRQSVMFYNRPSMQWEWNDKSHAKHDFTCCFQTWQGIRDNQLEMIVNFRSNDIIFGLFNDYYWACFVYQKLLRDLSETYLGLKPGKIYWNACSLHLYERHYDLLRKLTDMYK